VMDVLAPVWSCQLSVKYLEFSSSSLQKAVTTRRHHKQIWERAGRILVDTQHLIYIYTGGWAQCIDIPET
jgi:hypothetical protein